MAGFCRSRCYRLPDGNGTIACRFNRSMQHRAFHKDGCDLSFGGLDRGVNTLPRGGWPGCMAVILWQPDAELVQSVGLYIVILQRVAHA